MRRALHEACHAVAPRRRIAARVPTSRSRPQAVRPQRDARRHTVAECPERNRVAAKRLRAVAADALVPRAVHTTGTRSARTTGTNGECAVEESVDAASFGAGLVHGRGRGRRASQPRRAPPRRRAGDERHAAAAPCAPDRRSADAGQGDEPGDRRVAHSLRRVALRRAGLPGPARRPRRPGPAPAARCGGGPERTDALRMRRPADPVPGPGSVHRDRRGVLPPSQRLPPRRGAARLRAVPAARARTLRRSARPRAPLSGAARRRLPPDPGAGAPRARNAVARRAVSVGAQQRILPRRVRRARPVRLPIRWFVGVRVQSDRAVRVRAAGSAHWRLLQREELRRFAPSRS